MKEKGGGIQFEAAIGADGRIEVPSGILQRLGAGGGMRVHVRLLPARIALALERKNVTAEEVDRIASVQLESQEQVITFLLAEGALSHVGRKRRRTKGRKN